MRSTGRKPGEADHMIRINQEPVVFLHHVTWRLLHDWRHKNQSSNYMKLVYKKQTKTGWHDRKPSLYLHWGKDLKKRESKMLSVCFCLFVFVCSLFDLLMLFVCAGWSVTLLCYCLLFTQTLFLHLVATFPVWQWDPDIPIATLVSLQLNTLRAKMLFYD